MSQASSISKIFCHQGIPYLRVTPVKRLFNSTMIHEVVTRGDFFAVNLQTSALTILPKDSDRPCLQDANQLF